MTHQAAVAVRRQETQRAGASVRSGCWAGFTLIEVLVVVAILALLVSILLPSLKKARRQARVVVCSSNIGQLARGMLIYTQENKGRYAPHLANYPNQVQFLADMRPFPDYRRLLYERFANKQEKVIWCPVISSDYYMQPMYSRDNDPPWSKIYYVATSNPVGRGYGGSPSYMAGYCIYAGLVANPAPNAGEPATYSKSWAWEYSGNYSRKEEPTQASHTRDAIISDVNESWPKSGLGKPLMPYRTYHCETPDPLDGAAAETVFRFRESNVGFGDGSVETRKRPRHYVGRDGVGSEASGCYSY